MTTPTRRVLAPAAALGVLAALTACSTSAPITRPEVEAALTPTFTHLYVQQQRLLGHDAVTAATMRTSSACDRGGPAVADTGAGSDWICMVTWDDDTGAQQVGKFELQIHANACYTASGPASIIGSFTVTDTDGRDVTNPVNAFDGCFDPGAGAGGGSGAADAGGVLGSRVPGVDAHLPPITAVVDVVSVLPVLAQLPDERRGVRR